MPSIRSDLPAPRVRRVDDWTNYGDVPGVWAVINPSVFSQHGVYEREVLEPRSRQEVQRCYLLFNYVVCVVLLYKLCLIVNVGLVFKDSCERLILSLAVRRRLFYIDCILSCLCFMSK